MSPTLSVYDEGLVLYGALNVLHGHLPYRDFWSFYGPGEYYLLSILFRLFGVYAVVGRVVYIVTMLVILLSIIKVQLLLGGRRSVGLAGALIALIWANTAGTYLYPIYPAIALVFAAVLCAFRYWRYRRSGWILSAGALLGLVMMFRHDLALYSFISILGGECVYHLVPRDGDNRSEGRWKGLLPDVLLLSAGVVLTAGPGVFLLLRRVPFSDVRYQMFYIPSKIYPAMRHLPWFYTENVGLLNRISIHLMQGVSVVPIIAAIAAIVCLLNNRWRNQQEHWQISGYVTLLFLVLLIPLSAIVRPDIFHLAPAAAIDSVLLASLLAKRCLAGATGRFLVALAVGAFVITSLPPAKWVLRDTKHTIGLFVHPWKAGSIVSMCHPPVGMEAARCLGLDPADANEVNYIEQHTTIGEKVYSGTGRHDKLRLNDILFYFVSGRDAATKWYYLEPGLQTTYPIQEQMIWDLDRNHVRYVIRNLTWDQDCEPNASCKSSGVTVLDQYIDANYQTEATFPEVLILRRVTPF
jgi:hypothetical protein